MKERLDKFEIFEQIDPSGHTRVYRALEHMGQGVTRPAAIKVLQTWNLDDEAQLGVLRREVDVLVEVGASPNIVTIFGFGIDDEVGPWIAMELGGKSMKYFVGDDPAEPDQVRVLLRDVLRALVVVHGADPPILHRDLKPANILSSGFGVWKVADFGLAKRRGADETLNLVTVRYASPELLNATLGPESPRMDLYSLGMVAYEYALGRTLYRQQFPSVYDPYASADETAGDERPKWMYWHTSMQMSVPGVAELIEGFPEDLSQLIAAMTAKPIDERIESAQDAIARLGRVEQAAAPVEIATQEEPARSTRVSPAIILTLVVVLVLFGAGLIFTQMNAHPEISVAEHVEGAAPILRLSGVIEGFPSAGRAEVLVRGGSPTPFPVDVDPKSGSFTCDVSLRELGPKDAYLYVHDRSGNETARRRVVLERTPPETVAISLQISPPVSGAVVELTDYARANAGNAKPELASLRTDGQGRAGAQVGYGSFDIEIRHARFKPLARQTLSSGIDPEKPTLTVKLVALSAAAIHRKTADKMARARELAEKKANGTLSASEAAELERLAEELGQLAGDNPDVVAFLAAVDTLQEGDTGALAELRESAARANASIEAQEAQRRREVLAEGGPGATGARGAAAGAGAETVQGMLNSILGTAGAAGSGSADLSELVESMRAQGCSAETIASVLESVRRGDIDPSVGLDVGSLVALMALPLEQFRAFVRANVPFGALEVELVPHLNKVRLSGVLFDQHELKRLKQRLAAAAPRLQYELDEDAWALCRQLEAALTQEGAPGARVQPYLARGDNALYVQFEKSAAFDAQAARSLASGYVVDHALLRVQGYRPAQKAGPDAR